MYIPKSFEETDLVTLHEFICKYNFAILFNNGDDMPQATHLPFMIDRERGSYGTLIAHFAKANPHWKTLKPDQDVLVVFQGPHSYISSTWYRPPTSVPTWNYSAVHVYGKPHLTHDPSRLKEMVEQLVDFHEGREKIPGFDENFPDPLLQAIVGIEIPIERIAGKFKFSQNKTIEDQQGVIDALSQSKDSLRQAVAAMMRQNIEK